MTAAPPVPLVIRDATRDDVPAIVSLLAQDQMGGENEQAGPPLDPRYVAAFDAIDRDPNQRLLAAERDGVVIGTFQLSFTPGLLYHGGTRGIVEAVRVDTAMRGQGIGEAMMRWAIEACRARGCRVVQLTSNKARIDAHRFYDRLGFVASHTGFKMMLAAGE